ncbi:MAG: hypothetical protein ABI175_23670, partial [Polyangiales bacterium]
LRVAAALDRASVAYFVGGSLASSFQGEPRSTNDIDLVIDLAEPAIASLLDALGDDFSVDGDSLRDAVRRRTSCNIFFLPLVTKIDLFIRRHGGFDDSEFDRRKPMLVRGDRHLVLKSPEDTVLRKLLWYVEGGESSQRQWRDVVEVLRVSGPELDREYLHVWAERLGLSTLLDRAGAASA